MDFYRDFWTGLVRLVRHPIDSVRTWIANMRDAR